VTPIQTVRIKELSNMETSKYNSGVESYKGTETDNIDFRIALHDLRKDDERWVCSIDPNTPESVVIEVSENEKVKVVRERLGLRNFSEYVKTSALKFKVFLDVSLFFEKVDTGYNYGLYSELYIVVYGGSVTKRTRKFDMQNFTEKESNDIKNRIEKFTKESKNAVQKDILNVVKNLKGFQYNGKDITDENFQNIDLNFMETKYVHSNIFGSEMVQTVNELLKKEILAYFGTLKNVA
jgi:hypothetical protein